MWLHTQHFCNSAMPTPPRNNTARLLLEVAKNIEFFGEEHTRDILFKERTKNKCVKHLNFVIEMICGKFELEFEQMIRDKSRYSRKRVLAITLISYYGYEHFSNEGLSFQSIADRLLRTRTMVIRYHKSICENKKDKTKGNDYNQKVLKEFDLKVKEYLNNLKHTK